MSNVVPIRHAGTRGADELLVAPRNGGHLVHFYEDIRTLYGVVGTFVGSGLRAGERALLIATQEHARGIASHLAEASTDGALASGRLLWLDANEMLDHFMVGGTPDREPFHAAVSEALDRLTGGALGVPVRAFGEMVDVLCRRRNRRAALALEELWNEVMRERSVARLCGYVMSSFYEGGDDPGGGFAEVCQLHTHVLPPESFAQIERSAEPLVEISRLSDAARLLDAERRFRLLVASVRDYAVFMLDRNGFVTTWNPGAERIKGWAEQEIVGRHFSVLYPPEDVTAGKCERALAIAAERGRYEDEGWRVRKNGTFFRASVVITALRERGRLVGFAKVTRDIKGHRLATRRSMHELCRPIAEMQVVLREVRESGGRASAADLDALEERLREISQIVDDTWR
jgi:PAS domain S-box-containing protein